MDLDNRKQQHIVPKFYLEMFCDSNGQVSVLELEKHRLFLASPERICKEKYVYETEWKDANPKLGKYVLLNSIEKAFSEKEVLYKNLLDAVTRKCNECMNPNSLICSSEEKLLLADLVTNFHLRNPYVFQYILQKDYPIEELREIEAYKQTSRLFELMGWGSPDSLILHSVKQGLFDETINESPAKVTHKQLLAMNPVFFRSQNCRFITSSRPVAWVFLRDDDDTDVEEVVFIALSPRILLMYSESPDYRMRRNRVFDISDSMVRFFNQEYIVPNYEPVRFLIAQSKKDFDNYELPTNLIME